MCSPLAKVAHEKFGLSRGSQKTFLWERSRRKFKYSSMRPSRRVLRGPRRRSPSLLRYTVSQASKVERIGSRFLELVCSFAQCVPFCALQAWRLSCLRSTSLFPQRVASTSSVSNVSVGNTGHFDNEIDFTGSEGWKA